jgi:hypothetical protein
MARRPARRYVQLSNACVSVTTRHGGLDTQPSNTRTLSVAQTCRRHDSTSGRTVGWSKCDWQATVLPATCPAHCSPTTGPPPHRSRGEPHLQPLILQISSNIVLILIHFNIIRSCRCSLRDFVFHVCFCLPSFIQRTVSGLEARPSVRSYHFTT